MIPATVNGKRVKNLGWLLRNWQKATGFIIQPHPSGPRGERVADAVLIATLKDGGTYKTGFCNKEILRQFLDRPVFKGLPQRWDF